MDILKEQNYIVLTFNYKEVYLGKMLNPFNHSSIDNANQVIINLCEYVTVSKKGLKLMHNIIKQLREKDISVCIICSLLLKNLLEKIGFNKIVDIKTAWNLQKEDNTSVINLEKDLLWESLSEV